MLKAIRRRDRAMSDTSLAVLSWLVRPLQRAEDIAVALQVHPVTVFRHLQRLEHDGLVESITPGTIANSGRLYYLTQAGLLTAAQQRGVPPQT
jgi:predicted ArsR family transcriptional regulator